MQAACHGFLAVVPGCTGGLRHRFHDPEALDCLELGASDIGRFLDSLGVVIRLNRSEKPTGRAKQLLRLCPPSFRRSLFLSFSGSNEIEYTQGRAARHKLQPLRYSGMRFMISVALMPCSIAGNIHPICHQPDFIRHVLWAEDIHPDKTCGIIDKMWTETESLLDLGIHLVGHDKPAQNANRLLFQLSNSSRKNSSPSLRLQTVDKRIFTRNSDLVDRLCPVDGCAPGIGKPPKDRH